jgi:hypothetical protein
MEDVAVKRTELKQSAPRNPSITTKVATRGHNEGNARMKCKQSLRNGLLSLSVTASLIMPTLSRADTQITGVQILNVGVYAGSSGLQGAYVRFAPAIPAAEGCTYPPGDQIWIDFTSTTVPDGKTMYETVLKAYLANDLYLLSFGVRGCANQVQLPVVYRVDVALRR